MFYLSGVSLIWLLVVSLLFWLIWMTWLKRISYIREHREMYNCTYIIVLASKTFFVFLAWLLLYHRQTHEGHELKQKHILLLPFFISCRVCNEKRSASVFSSNQLLRLNTLYTLLRLSFGTNRSTKETSKVISAGTRSSSPA